MVKFCYFFYFLGSLFFFFLLTSCAHVVPLTGGKLPERAPKIVYQYPAHKATNIPVDTKKIILKFDTYIKCSNPQKEFFISPPILPAPDIQVKAKSIEIKLKSPLLPNTCYTIQTNGTIQEYYSNTPLPSQNFVFSTGNTIDTLTLSGIVKDEWQKPLPSMIVCAYCDVPLDSIGKISPHYTTIMQPDGSFMFKYIREGKYYLLALKDVNNNYKKDLPNEITAILPTPIDPRDSIKPILTLLYDAQTPLKIQSADTLNKVLRITLSKGVWIDKTFIQGKKPILLKDYKKLYFTNLDFTQPILLHTTDSSGIQKIDTIKISTVKSKWNDKIVMLNTQILPNEPLIFYAEKPVQWHAEPEVYQDKKRIPIRIDTNPFQLKIYPDKGLWKEGSTYQIENLYKVHQDIDTATKSFIITAEKNIGGISGKIQGKNPKDIVYFVSLENSSIRYVVEKDKFEFMYLLPGKYQFIAIEDANQDGIWNGGSFEYKLLPERIRYSKVYTIRPNWIYEEEVIDIP